MNGTEIVHAGWLTKSPPEKRIWKAKWRRRWFVLRHSGQLPGQFILEYYTDPSKRKLKGKIDLDQCEQVDSGLTFDARKFNQLYKFIFDIRTSKRTYYLVAESESEMVRWVDAICSVCGLKIHVEDEFEPNDTSNGDFENNNEVERVQNTMEISLNNDVVTNNNEPESQNNQYIFISDCISGRPISADRDNCETSYDLLKDAIGSLPNEPPPPPPKVLPDRLISGEFYDYPRPLQPVASIAENASLCELATVPNMSQFPPHVNWNTYPNESVDSPAADDSTMFNLENCSIHDSEINQNASFGESFQDLIPPPRPPKPANLGERRNYENASPILGFSSTKRNSDYATDESFSDQLSPDSVVPPPSANSVISADDLYDFPRPLHEGIVDIVSSPPAPNVSGVRAAFRRPRRHAYSNAPAGFVEEENNVFRYDSQATIPVSSPSYLSMDGNANQQADVYTEMSGDSHSTPSLTPTTPGAVYCNVLPATPGNVAIFDLPPVVNRNLKPKKKVSDGKLKGEPDKLTLAPPPACRMKSDQQSVRKMTRNVPSPTLSSQFCHSLPHRHRNSDQSSDDDTSNFCDSPHSLGFDNDHFFPSHLKKLGSEIQYLDLDLDLEAGQVSDVKSPKTPDKSSTTTVYKTVDFIKTKAFNETRQNIETYRKKSQN